MIFITNPCESHLTAQQHERLARHYKLRHFAIATTQIIGKSPAAHVRIDYSTMWQKQNYHQKAAKALRDIEAQRRTEAGLLALGTVAADCDACGFADCQCGQYEPEDTGWCRVCNTEEGRGQCLNCLLERQAQRLDAPVVVKLNAADVQAGRTYYRHGDAPDKAFTVLSITGIDAYQRQASGGIYRVAQVKLVNGDTAEKRIYAQQQYVEVR